MPSTTTYLDPRTLAAVASLELRSRMIVEGMMTGMHRSPHFGYSVEFAQHRQYAPGDDIRHLDWKVFGRNDKLYLKQYQKETNLDLVLMVDVSGSMAFGTDFGRKKGESPGIAMPGLWRKYDWGATVAATLAHMALKQQDRVSVVTFAEELRTTTRTGSARDHWRTIVDALAGAKVDPIESDQSLTSATAAEVKARATSLTRLFDQVTARLRQRSLLVLISDMFDEPAALEHGLARAHHRRHDMVVLQVLDNAELTFPFRSPSEFLGLEGEGRLPLDPPALREAYLEAINAHLDAVKEMTRRFGFDYLLVDTSENLGPTLSHFLARRAAIIDKKK
ncbi:MAG: DUF58 domain-containing protein [Phycisphaeraceae bacterium]